MALFASEELFLVDKRIARDLSLGLQVQLVQQLADSFEVNLLSQILEELIAKPTSSF